MKSCIYQAYCRVAGWGNTENGTLSDTLMDAELRGIMTPEECRHKTDAKIENHICGGGISGDSCTVRNT